MNKLSAKFLMKQPLIHFFLAGILIFVLTSINNPEPSQISNRITIDNNVVNKLKGVYESQMGTVPGDLEINNLVLQHIEDEILYREALRNGLEHEDEIIRRRLIQKMRYLSSLSSNDAGISAQELLDFFKENANIFKQPATVSFEHLYFNPDIDSYPLAKQRAQNELERLLASDSENTTAHSTSGDQFPLQNKYIDLNQKSAFQLFGNSPFIEGLFSTAEKQWDGPYQSGYGWHLIYIDHKSPRELPPFNTVKTQVLAEFQQYQQQQTSNSNMKEMRQRYEIQLNHTY